MTSSRIRSGFACSSARSVPFDAAQQLRLVPMADEVVLDQRGKFRFILHDGDFLRHGTCLAFNRLVRPIVAFPGGQFARLRVG